MYKLELYPNKGSIYDVREITCILKGWNGKDPADILWNGTKVFPIRQKPDEISVTQQPGMPGTSVPVQVLVNNIPITDTATFTYDINEGTKPLQFYFLTE